jgi:hypothetical protein
MKGKSKDTGDRTFNINDAKKYGMIAACILYDIRFWLRFNLKEKKNVHHGRVWTFHTMKTFAEKFRVTERQVRAIY